MINGKLDFVAIANEARQAGLDPNYSCRMEKIAWNMRHLSISSASDAELGKAVRFFFQNYGSVFYGDAQ